jgi:putative SOS response-associated peptidase YedK
MWAGPVAWSAWVVRLHSYLLFFRRDGLPIAFAGLWENAKELHGTTAIVTTSEETQQIHDRMPIILEKPDFLRLLASEVDQTGCQKSSALKRFQVLSATPKAVKTTSDEPRRKSAKKA